METLFFFCLAMMMGHGGLGVLSAVPCTVSYLGTCIMFVFVVCISHLIAKREPKSNSQRWPRSAAVVPPAARPPRRRAVGWVWCCAGGFQRFRRGCVDLSSFFKKMAMVISHGGFVALSLYCGPPPGRKAKRRSSKKKAAPKRRRSRRRRRSKKGGDDDN